MGWTFIIPESVIAELDETGIGKPIQSLVDQGEVLIEKCSEPLVDIKLSGIDPGEYEMICIVLQCPDKTFKNYLILTDDRKAQHVAGHLGMSSHDVLVFLQICNKNGLLASGDARDAFFKLSGVCRLEKGYRNDFLSRLIGGPE